MNTLPFLHFFTLLVYFYLLVLVLWKDPKSWLNRSCAALLACFALWNFGYIFVHNLNVSKDSAMLFGNIGSIGWGSFASFALWFVLIFTEKKKILKSKLFYPFIFILPLLFIYKQWTGFFLIADHIKRPWGWVGVWSGSIWPYLYYLYYLSFIAIGLYLIFNFKKKTKEIVREKQAGIIFITGVVSLILGTFTEVVLPKLNIRTIPPLTSFTTLIWAFGIAYAIVKYKLMVITPVVAAESIISTMADSLILLDGEGNIATVNKATLDLSGYGEDELKGKSVEIFFTEKDFKNALLDKTIKKEAIRNYELNFKTKTGDNIPVIFSSSTMMDKAGGLAGIVCIVKDINERKKAENRLREEKKLFNILMDNILDSIYFKDKEKRFIRVNRVKAEHSGVAPEEMIGKTDFDFFPKEIAIQSFADDNRIMESGRSIIDKIEKIIHLDKREYWASVTKVPWYDEEGRITGVIGITRDITERKQAEEQIQLHAAMMDNVAEGVYLVGLDDLLIKWTNEKFAKMFGYNPGEMVGKQVDIVNAPTERTPAETRISIVDVIKGTGEWHGEVRNIKRDGTPFWCYANVSLFDHRKYGKVMISVHIDITERKQAQEALQEAHDQLENKVVKRTGELQKANLRLQELDRLKTMFIASMNHELRTPLTLIIGFTDIILQEISGEINQEQRRQFTLVKKNANHLLSLINDILDVNKIETGKVEMIIEEFDLSALSQEIKDNFRIAADKKELELSFKIPPTLLIESDRRRTKQILVNLLSNALKFTDRGEIKIKIATKDKMVEMSVQDSGSGIKKEDMDKLFNAFSQIPNPGKIEEGTGLGLYLSKKNANLLGGDIRAESEPGKGSVFTLRLPLKYKETKVWKGSVFTLTLPLKYKETKV